MTSVAVDLKPTKSEPAFEAGRFGRSSVVYGVGIVLGKAVSLVMLPVYTRYLTPADYGVLALIQMTFEIVIIFAGTNLAVGVFRFYAKADRAEDKKAVLSTGLLLLGLFYGIVGVATYLLAHRISGLVFQTDRYAGLIRIASGSMFGEGMLLVPFAYLRLNERAGVFVAVQTGRVLTQVGLTVLFLVVLGAGVRGVLLSALIANLTFGFIMVIAVVRQVSLKLSPLVAWDLLRFGAPLVAGRAATFVLTFGDRYFLQSVGSTAVVGLYSLSYQFGFLLSQLVAVPFVMVWEPLRFEVAKRADRDEVCATTFIYLNLFLFTAAVGLSVFVDPILRIMAAPAFYEAARIVPIILAAYVLQTWMAFHEIGLMVTERTRAVGMANWIGMGVALICYATFIPVWFGLGAALATLVAFAVRSAIVYWASQRLWPLRYRWRPVILTLGAATAVTVAASALPAMGLGASLVARAALFLAYLVAAWYLPILSEAERSHLRTGFASPRAAIARFIAGDGHAGGRRGPEGRRKPVRVLYYYSGRQLDTGSPRALVASVELLDRGLIEPCFLDLGGGPLAQALDAKGATLFEGDVSPVTLRRPLRSASRILQQAGRLRDWRIDLLHVNEFGWNLDLVLGAWIARVPVVLHSHLPDVVAFQNLHRLLARRVLLASESQKNAMIGFERIRHKAEVFNNPVDVDAFGSGHSIRAALGLPPTATVIGTVAQIRLGKGIDVLLAAAESLLAEFPDVIFAIVGPPGRGEEEFAARMVDAAKKEPLAGRVRFVGSRPDVPDVLASFDIFCLPTRAETFGIAVVEAMAAGLPVVAGDVGALRELVTSPDVGILVPPGDAAALADALRRLLRLVDRGRAMGRAGQTSLAGRFDRANASARLHEIYNRVLTGAARPASEGAALRSRSPEQRD